MIFIYYVMKLTKLIMTTKISLPNKNNFNNLVFTIIYNVINTKVIIRKTK